MIASGLVAAAIALPWLVLLPLRGVPAVLACAIALVAAFHGAGLVIARLANRSPGAPLLVQWGIATLIGLSGIAIALHVGTLATHAALVFGFVGVHTASLALGFAGYVDRVAISLGGKRTWLVPVGLLAALGALVVLGAAAESFAQPFDDEGNVVAQLRRVLDTGTLGDPIGYPRNSQLGAQVAIAAVASGAADGLTRVVEPLALALALALAISRIRARDAGSALWATALVVTAFALALAPLDPLPCWTGVGLIVALFAMLAEPEPAPALPFAITAGALIALRYELGAVAAVAALVTWWQRRTDHRRTAVLIGGMFAVVFPFLVARMVAWRSVPMAAHNALASPEHTALVLRLALAAAIALPAAFVFRLALPDSRAIRAAATATAVALGAIAAHVISASGYSLRLAWPVAIAFAITLLIEHARSRSTGAVAVIAALVLAVFIRDGSEAPGRLRWSRRLASAATELEDLRWPAAAADPYRPLLESVPSGATVAVWVAEPERLDYAEHRILDLRTPAGARLREHRFVAHASKIAPLLSQLSASYLLVEADDAHVRRTQSELLYRWICRSPQAICDDDLEAIARGRPTLAERAGVRLIDLRR